MAKNRPFLLAFAFSSVLAFVDGLDLHVFISTFPWQRLVTTLSIS